MSMKIILTLFSLYECYVCIYTHVFITNNSEETQDGLILKTF